MEYDIFISYSRADSAIVNTFVQKLESAGYSVWIDKAGVYSGSQFKSMIVEAIEDSKVFLFFSSKDANASPWTAKEVGIAVNRQKPIIPIKLDDTDYNRVVEFDLINLDYINYKDKSSGEDECKKLMSSLEILLGEKQHVPQPDPKPDPQSVEEKNGQEKEKKGQAKLEFLKNNRGCTITIALMSLIVAIGVPLYYLTNQDYLSDDSNVYANPTSSIKDVPADHNTPQLIDLDLPSGTLWADRNLGATAPKEPGMYLAWAETEEKEEYTDETYFNCKRIDDDAWTFSIVKDDISGTKYDAATMLLGPDYRMPSKDDMEELINSCKWEYKEFNGKAGYEITGSNGQSIFLPACGIFYDDGLDDTRSGGAYWTSTGKYGPFGLRFYGTEFYEVASCFNMAWGLQIRPVSKKNVKQ